MSTAIASEVTDSRAGCSGPFTVWSQFMLPSCACSGQSGFFPVSQAFSAPLHSSRQTQSRNGLGAVRSVEGAARLAGHRDPEPAHGWDLWR